MCLVADVTLQLYHTKASVCMRGCLMGSFKFAVTIMSQFKYCEINNYVILLYHLNIPQ